MQHLMLPYIIMPLSYLNTLSAILRLLSSFTLSQLAIQLEFLLLSRVVYWHAYTCSCMNTGICQLHMHVHIYVIFTFKYCSLHVTVTLQIPCNVPIAFQLYTLNLNSVINYIILSSIHFVCSYRKCTTVYCMYGYSDLQLVAVVL